MEIEESADIETATNDPQVTSDDDEREQFTAASALKAIQNAWLNEKFAPEILPHQSDLVDCMLQQIAHMEENTKRLERDDLRFVIHKMEINRVRFIISSYLRTRLEKIERYAIAILTEEGKREEDDCYLSVGETKFAKEYLASVESLFSTIALRHMPPNFQKFQISNLAIQPNMHTHVFVRANRSVTGVIVPGKLDQEIEFEAGSQHVVQYKAVADLVKNGTVCLI